MTTREAIEARHVRKPAGVDWCGVCDVAWPCDTAQLLAALDETKVPWQHVLDDLHATSEREARLADALDALAKSLSAEAFAAQAAHWQAAEAREARLRAALDRFLDMLAPGGALYGCGEQHLRESAVFYLSNLATTPEADA